MRDRIALTVLLTVCLLAGCGKKAANNTAPDVTPTPAPAPAVPPAPSPAPSGGGGNTNFVAGGGAVQNVRQAGRRTVALNDLHQLGLAVKQAEILDGTMPDAARIKAEAKAFPNIAAAIDDGTIVLTGSTDPAGLWAYEVDADTKGGIVLVGGTASRATADEVKQHLARLPKPPVVTPKTTGALDNRPAPRAAAPAPAAPAVAVGPKDLEDVRLFIDTASLASGQMPTVAQTYAALKQSGSPAAALVEQGAIVLTGATTREGVWAFEYAAATRGGLVCGPNGVETLTAAELKARRPAGR